LRHFYQSYKVRKLKEERLNAARAYYQQECWQIFNDPVDNTDRFFAMRQFGDDGGKKLLVVAVMKTRRAAKPHRVKTGKGIWQWDFPHRMTKAALQRKYENYGKENGWTPHDVVILEVKKPIPREQKKRVAMIGGLS
jgi:hypothetical protein